MTVPHKGQKRMTGSEGKIAESNACFCFFVVVVLFLSPILSYDLKRNPGPGLLLPTVCNAALNLSSHSLTLAVGGGTE